jgi:hypothetical protein
MKQPRDDRATTARRPCDNPATTNGWRQQSLRKESSSSAQRTPILSAKDSNPFRRGLQSLPQRTPILCAKDSHLLRRNSRGRRCGRLRSRQNSAALRYSAHIHRPYSARRSHPLSSRGRRCGRLRSRQNSAALRFSAHIHRPYSVDVHILNRPHPQSSTSSIDHIHRRPHPSTSTSIVVHILRNTYKKKRPSLPTGPLDIISLL